MQKTYVMHYIIAASTIIFSSLSATQAPNIYTAGPLHRTVTIIVKKPYGGFFEITEKNRPQCNNYFKKFGITLNEQETKIIYIMNCRQIDENNNNILANNVKFIQNTPQLLPLSLFTTNKMPPSSVGLITVQYKSNWTIAESFFESHNNLLLGNNNAGDSTIRFNSDNIKKEAITFQKNLESKLAPELDFLISPTENEPRQEKVIEQKNGNTYNTSKTGFTKTPITYKNFITFALLVSSCAWLGYLFYDHIILFLKSS